MAFLTLLHISSPAAGLLLALHVVQHVVPGGGLIHDAHVLPRLRPPLPEGYHTPDELYSKIQKLKLDGGCAVPITADWVMDSKLENKGLFVVRLGEASSAKKRILIVANEHAREAITAEVAVHFVERVCAGTGEAMLGLPDNVGITLVPVANHAGRVLFDDGNTCQRNTADEGEGEIDLNRNGEVDWVAEKTHGSQPFSAYQSRILRDLAVSERPVAYVDLHSGAETLMVPWGQRAGVTTDFLAQSSLLQEVAAKSCPNCQIGSNRLVIDYENPGEIIDYMYARAGVKYSTLWEVFQGTLNGDCVSFFNPSTSQLPAVKTRWANGLHRFVELIGSDVEEGDHSKVLSDAELEAHVVSSGGPHIAGLQLPLSSTRHVPNSFLTT